MSRASWIAPLQGKRSLGSSAPRPGGLAGLAAARERHHGQFWTPDAAAALLWRIAEQAMSRLDRTIHLIDTSAGIGRLLQFADPSRHTVAGIDVDGEAIEGLAAAAEVAGFSADFLCAGLQEVRPSGFDVALLNPPFGLTLSAPTLESYSCTAWGAYGPSTSARSHAYAVHQALDAAPVVVAIVPHSYAIQVLRECPPEFEGRLRAVIGLPAGTFGEENTEVSVSVLVFGADAPAAPPVELALARLDDPLPDLGLAGSLKRGAKPSPLASYHEDSVVPAITGDVTGDRTVRVVHNGRWIHLKSSCALTHAKVMNAVLVGPVDAIQDHRYPDGVRFQGQGKLDIEVLLLQPCPQAAFDGLQGIIRAAGGDPLVDPGLANYLRKQIRRHQREAMPFGHWVRDGIDVARPLHATARRKRLLDPAAWGSPVIQKGQEVLLETDAGGGYVLRIGSAAAPIQEADLTKDFHVPPAAGDEDGWREVAVSREAAFPDLAKAIRVQLNACGAGAIAGWGYQMQDMVELLMGRHGYSAWRPGCGKGRLAIALAHHPGKHHAILVESHLVASLLEQLEESVVDPGMWQVIRTPGQCRRLRKINIVSYETLRRPIASGAGRRTYARLLRRRFCRVLADEAQLLRHMGTAQTRAVWMLSPKRRVAMSGTPQPNYVQDLLPAMQWVYGDGTAVQPYGRHRPYLEPRLYQSMTAAERGIDAFSRDFVVVEWVSREFKDGLEHGAKRQVPRIRNVPKLRTWAAPLLKRRMEDEPMVAPHFNAVQPVVKEIPLDWDDHHLAHYIRVADEFKQWYLLELERANDRGRPMNTVLLLARIAAVAKACNLPQYRSDSAVFRAVPAYASVTSKQRYVLGRLKDWAGEGRKSICYVDSPQAANFYARHLERAGVEAVAFHGDRSIAQRNVELRDRFKRGSAQVLVASIQTIERGHNLYCASRGIFACRSWSGSTEEQGGRRMCRPQQTEEVVIEKPNLRGSIDDYQAQMSSMKLESAGAAIDFLTPEDPDREFIHLDRILNQFVERLAHLQGRDVYEMRQEIRNAA